MSLLEIGKYHELTILRETSVGLYLGNEVQVQTTVDEERKEKVTESEIEERKAHDKRVLGISDSEDDKDLDESEFEEVGEGFGEVSSDVLLPKKYCPKKFRIGDKIKVFVYLDYDERRVATNIIPKIALHEFAFLRVVSVSQVGAFMDWGLEKDLMVPFREQRQKMQEGRWYIVYLDLDRITDRLFASNKIDKYLKNDPLTVKEGEKVDLLVMQKTDLGYTVIVNQIHKGLVYRADIYRELNVGEKTEGYIKKIRPDNKLDISLQAIGYANYNDANTEAIYKALVAGGGHLGLNDKSSPDEIYLRFGMSKKAFKKSLGSLYKQHKISMDDDGIRLRDEV